MSDETIQPDRGNSNGFHYNRLPSAIRPRELSDADRRFAASVVALGCDRSTVAKYLGLRPAEWARILADDPDLDRDLARAEAKAEVHHMKCVHDAAEEPKNYRGSTWWLERMRPDVYDRRDAGVLAKDFLEQIAEIIGTEVHDDVTRNRIFARLQAMARV